MYGSLRRGEANPEADALHAGSRWLGPAHVRGHMAELNGFPALVSGRHGRVDGELVHVTDPALWERLDAYEGVGETGWYARGLVVALDQHGEARSAWAYMVPPLPGKPATD